MTLRVANVTFDCKDAAATAEFWAKALDRSPAPGLHDPFITVLPADAAGEPSLMFLAVPEGKAVKNRVHLDLVADDRHAEVARLVALGATDLGEHAEAGFTWTTLQDPHGNEFCVANGHDG